MATSLRSTTIIFCCIAAKKHSPLLVWSMSNHVHVSVDKENVGYENAAFGVKPQGSKQCSSPVPVDQFLKHVITLMETKDGFKNEFIVIIVSTKDYNLEKNRFVNILAYDRTRVILDAEERTDYVNIKNVKNDYINANYVDGYKKKREFIASQGPLNTTIIDFWKLIWQNNVSKIVMVTNIIEKGRSKCAYYWPHEGSETYGAIKVRLEKEDIYPEYVVRILELTKGKEKKTLLQFHFTAWPDEGAPTTGTSLLALQDLVKSTQSTNNNSPVLIHCSAGIGRTGTYIAVDYLKKQAAEEGIIDILSCVDRMREDRINMVQSLSLLKKNAYIVTQMPLPHTQMDFWRLVTDYECRCLLMLNEQVHESKDDASYWPLTSEDPPVICGPFMVKTTAVSDTDSMVLTHLNINEQNIYHIWLKGWPDAEPLPHNTRILIDLYRQLKDAKVLSDEKPLLIHCLFGVDKSGLVSAAMSLLEAVEDNLYVDVFNVVKRIRRSRPKFIATLAQYRFLHLLARDFIEMKCSVKLLV
ncbi:hypothetical protein LSH36_404g02011 [Paralvinella palmiformis]|uniref:protein-tyrosine-phosphatase n=1 Tax=Paralvinella palmiformis TaxID=53620 RepID=A0AAD9MYG3_9ANNE|nr:hypothetical protein LSH36_404g02011 [Paralvinella palmiformis]